jgi:hypothetical protein
LILTATKQASKAGCWNCSHDTDTRTVYTKQHRCCSIRSNKVSIRADESNQPVVISASVKN